MSNCVGGDAPWLSSVNENDCCTVVEGAEVVRTAAVSYATPILHQVFIKNSSPPYRTVVTGSQLNNPCYKFKNHSSNEREDKTSLVSSCVSTSDGPLHTRPTFRKKVEVQLDPVCSETFLNSSSSIKLSSPFSSSSHSTIQPSEAVSSSLSVRCSTSSSSSSPQLLPPEVAAFTFPLVSSSVITSVSSSPTATPSSPSSPSQALNYSSSPPLTESRPDDELTSLSWLQDSNLLRGTTLTSLKPNKSTPVDNATAERKRQRPTKKEKSESSEVVTSRSSFRREVEDDSKEGSPSSDSAEEPNDEMERLEPCQTTSTQPVPYNPKVHTMAKPPFSFSCLIFMAIEESSSKALPVKDIYTWIVDHYPYYKSAPTGWKNSVRHNLSLNKCFSKVEKAPSLGKGSLWMVDPNHRPNLLQAMSKAPFTSVSPLDRSYTLSSKSMVNSEWQFNVAQKTQEINGKYVLGDVIQKSAVESVNMPLNVSEILCDPTYRKSTSSPKLRIPTRQYHRNTSLDTSPRKLIQTPHCNDNNNLDLVSNNNIKKNNSVNTRPISVPNPELFPRLAKRLELNSLYESHLNAGSYAIDVEIEDVDAATAMLVLKHGPQMLSPFSETCNQLRKSQYSFAQSFPTSEKRKRDKHLEYIDDDPRRMYVSSSPSVDHSYICPREDARLHENMQRNVKQMSIEKNSSFQNSNGVYDDENIKPFASGRNYYEHPMEEASALLNLASIATSLASKRDESNLRLQVTIPYSEETHNLFAETQSETQLKKTAKKNNVVNKQKLSTKNVNKLKSEFAITVNSRLSNRKLYKPKAKIFSLELDGELNAKPSNVANSRYNNNSKDVVNRNKFLKVKKLCLRRHKTF